MYEKISCYDWLFDVRYYESPSVTSFRTNVDDATKIIVVLLAVTRGRQAASEVLLGQDFGNTLTAAPVSIK